MNKTEKRSLIHQKLEVMKTCYEERDPKNFERFYDTFFDRSRLPIIIGTDNGPWFHTMGRIRWLFNYDWEHWGNLEVDTWNFRVSESDTHDMIRTRGILDFGQGQIWDIDIIMIFTKGEKAYRCRLMQFKIPRNEIRPVVFLSHNPEEQTKAQKEMRDVMGLNGEVSGDLMRSHVVDRVTGMLRDQRPYLEIIDLRKEMVYVEEYDDGFFFALTGFGVHTELNAVMPFRMVGIGQGYEILDSEFSHPFVSSLG